ncbi:hypothetical protein BDC45DRAFT_535638 [Circinella umbellata]|nr:hypothetical protein BDC45DRAFT_535638 [Circinella umbellata]
MKIGSLFTPMILAIFCQKWEWETIQNESRFSYCGFYSVFIDISLQKICSVDILLIIHNSSTKTTSLYSSMLYGMLLLKQYALAHIKQRQGSYQSNSPSPNKYFQKKKHSRENTTYYNKQTSVSPIKSTYNSMLSGGLKFKVYLSAQCTTKSITKLFLGSLQLGHECISYILSNAILGYRRDTHMLVCR